MAERSSRQQLPTGDVELDVLVAGDGPTVVLVHGFPELGYSWRHQIDPLVDAGYRVVVPDMRGYASAFEASGFTGGLNWYRNLHRNWELMAPWHHARIRVPALFVAGDRDPVLTGLGVVDEEHPLIAVQRDGIDDLTVRIIEGAGHWTQQERPQATTQVLLDFLARVAPT